MRGLLYVLTAVCVVALGFWAYQENYRTQGAIREVRSLNARIGAAHARLNVLSAEWAYLNRPDRLRELADANFDRLGLLPLTPEAFGHPQDIAMPLPPIPELGPIMDPVEISAGQRGPNGEEPL
ncbi:cell division protein FtsL [Wenxinia marina]|uniref:Putative secreted (Periplasmic) protein n=1 Tax=Wenxinia marina DSM 24838 TaxID=1123501 RepID=A0A0D0QBS5_9RHOB|nr:hypothetical protein [Wenxinia marina]KIQ69717.1 putative secreted (periplasmic) protein [Wenxinia marina DSM 24838]GGL60658.1 cell division protein FtsL [Wenxinia marina]